MANSGINPHHHRLYLASRSPRRRELLTQIGVQFDTLFFRAPPREDHQVDETPHAGEAPVDYVQRVARAKAEFGVALVRERKLPMQLVLSADTTLEFEGRIIGKPADADEARAILGQLSGRTHRVLTAVAVAREAQIESVLSISAVSFGTIDPADIRRYVMSGEPLDKAGAYGIQGYAGLFVERLEGSYTGVMGLPLHETGVLLRKSGFPL